MGSANVIANPSVIISGNELNIGNESVASWKDDVSKSCKVELGLTLKAGTGKTINS